MTIIRGTLSVRRWWTCRCCGAQEIGEPLSCDVDTTSAQLERAFDKWWRTKPFTDFPVGWAGYGGGAAACPKCIT